MVDLLNLTTRSVEKNVVESLEREDPKLAEEIKKRMFVFEDLTLLDGATMARILTAADSADTALALKMVRSTLTRNQTFIVFSLFALSTPIGIFFGEVEKKKTHNKTKLTT